MTLPKAHLAYLRKICRCKTTKRRRELLRDGGAELQRSVREIAHNVLKGNVRLNAAQLKRLKQHRQGLRLVSRKSTTGKKRLQIEQRGGFLGALIAPLISALAGGIGGLLGGGQR